MTAFGKGVWLVTAPIAGVFLGWQCSLVLTVMDRLLPDVLPGVSFVTMLAIKGIFTMFE